MIFYSRICIDGSWTIVNSVKSNPVPGLPILEDRIRVQLKIDQKNRQQWLKKLLFITEHGLNTCRKIMLVFNITMYSAQVSCGGELVFSERTVKKYSEISQEPQIENVKSMSRPTESTDFIFYTLKCNPISGETVHLSCPRAVSD